MNSIRVKNKEVSIQKMTGELEAFDENKLKHSLQRSGANDQTINQVIDKVKESLYDGITTRKIYKMAFAILRKTSRPIAARYKLKKAIYQLGPSGFPFEKFVANILNQEGFKTNTGVIVQGHCVNHEVDVVAEKDEKHFMVECKFHGEQGRHCDVKIPLYIQSRFIDVEKRWLKEDGHDTKFHQGWIFTNTRFSADATQYGNCAGLMLVGWDYPKQGSLKERIDKSGLHPITCLTTISKNEKQKLLMMDIVLCRDISAKPELLSSIGINNERHQNILKEVQDLCLNIKK